MHSIRMLAHLFEAAFVRAPRAEGERDMKRMLERSRERDSEKQGPVSHEATNGNLRARSEFKIGKEGRAFLRKC